MRNCPEDDEFKDLKLENIRKDIEDEKKFEDDHIKTARE